MKVYDVTDRFLDNAIPRKPRVDVVAHWTAGRSVGQDLNWLDKRLGGKGSVGYNLLIARNGDRYLLANIDTHFMHNSGLGSRYDRNTISFSFCTMGAKEGVTPVQVESAREFIAEIRKKYEIRKLVCHAEINSKKPDFPEEMWKELKAALLR